MYACMYAYIRVCMNLCVYACMYICMHVCIHICIYVILKLGFERYGGGNFPSWEGNCPGGGMSVPHMFACKYVYYMLVYIYDGISQGNSAALS